MSDDPPGLPDPRPSIWVDWWTADGWLMRVGWSQPQPCEDAALFAAWDREDVELGIVDLGGES